MSIRSSAGGRYTRALSLTAPFTITFWARIATDRNAVSTLFKSVNTGAPTSSWTGLETDNTGTQLQLTRLAATTNIVNMTVGTWYQIAYVRTGSSSADIYYAPLGSDLTLVTVASAGALGTQNSSTIAGSDSANNFNGNIANFKVFNGLQLSLSEIQQELAQFLPARSGVTAWYPFINAGVEDYSGNGNNLTLTSTITTEDNPPIIWEQIQLPFHGRPSTAEAGKATTSSTGDAYITTCNVPVPQGATKDDIVLVGLGRWESSAPAITLPSGFTLLDEITVAGNNSKLAIAWKRLTGNDTGNYAFSWTGQQWTCGQAIRVPGAISSGDPFQQWAKANFTGTSYGAGVAPVTVPDDTCALVSFVYHEGSGTSTEPTGYTEAIESTILNTNYRNNPPAGTYALTGGSLPSGLCLVYNLAIKSDTTSVGGPVVHQGDTAMTAVAALSSAGAGIKVGSASLNALAALTTNQFRNKPANIAITATASLAASTPMGIKWATTQLTATAALIANRFRAKPATVALTASGSLTVTPFERLIATSSLNAAANLTVAIQSIKAASASLNAIPGLSVSIKKTAFGSTTLNAVSLLVAGVIRNAQAVIALEGVAQLVASSSKIANTSQLFNAVAEFVAASSKVGVSSANLTAGANLSAATVRLAFATALLAASSQIEVSATERALAISNLSAIANLSSSTDGGTFASVDLNADATFTSSIEGVRYAGVNFDAAASLILTDIEAGRLGAAALTAVGALQIAAYASRHVVAELTTEADLSTGSGQTVAQSSVLLSSNALLDLEVDRNALSGILFDAHAQLFVDTQGAQFITALLQTAATLTTTPTKQSRASVVLDALAELDVAGTERLFASAILNCVSVLTAGTYRDALVAVDLEAHATLSSVTGALVPSTVTLTALATLLAEGRGTDLGAVTLNVDVDLVLSGLRVVALSVDLQAMSALELDDYATRLATALFNTHSILDTDGRLNASGSVVLDAVATLLVNLDSSSTGTVDMDALANLVLDGTRIGNVAANLSADPLLIIDGSLERLAAVNLVTEALLDVSGVVPRQALVNLVAVAQLMGEVAVAIVKLPLDVRGPLLQKLFRVEGDDGGRNVRIGNVPRDGLSGQGRYTSRLEP